MDRREMLASMAALPVAGLLKLPETQAKEEIPEGMPVLRAEWLETKQHGQMTMLHIDIPTDELNGLFEGVDYKSNWYVWADQSISTSFLRHRKIFVPKNLAFISAFKNESALRWGVFKLQQSIHLGCYDRLGNRVTRSPVYQHINLMIIEETNSIVLPMIKDYNQPFPISDEEVNYFCTLARKIVQEQIYGST